MRKALKKLFGGINLTWPKLIIFALIMGVYTALMALLVPDGNSFHDIVATVEWWILPAVLIIVNCKKPLDAALKVFAFFLISQPLVYLIQVPFNSMGWNLFGYYPYWFRITLLTLPAGFIGWFIKKDKWYSAIILSGMTVLLAIMGVGFVREMIENPPNHLVTIIYCFVTIVLLIFCVLKSKIPRIIASAITVIAIIVCAMSAFAEPYEAYRQLNLEEYEITFVGEPSITLWSGTGKGDVVLNHNDDNYVLKLSGVKGGDYEFDITDDEHKYHFEYYFDNNANMVVLNKTGEYNVKVD